MNKKILICIVIVVVLILGVSIFLITRNSDDESMPSIDTSITDVENELPDSFIADTVVPGLEDTVEIPEVEISEDITVADEVLSEVTMDTLAELSGNTGFDNLVKDFTDPSILSGPINVEDGYVKLSECEGGYYLESSIIRNTVYNLTGSAENVSIVTWNEVINEDSVKYNFEDYCQVLCDANGRKLIVCLPYPYGTSTTEVYYMWLD